MPTSPFVQSNTNRFSLKKGALLLATGATYAISRMSGFISGNAASSYAHEVDQDDALSHSFNSASRHLLHSNNEVNVSYFFPDQTVELSKSYAFNVSTIFSGDYWMLLGQGLPEWLKPQYNTINYYNVYAEKLVVQDNIAYVIDGNLHILNLSDLTNITELSTYSTNGYSTSVLVYNNTAYLVADDLFILDVSNLKQPKLLSNFSIEADRTQYKSNAAIALSEDVVFIKDAKDVHFLNVSDPSNPQKLGAYEFPNPDVNPGYAGLTVYGQHLYMTRYDGLYIVDVSDFANPRLTSFFPGLGYQGISLYKGIAYIPAGPYGLDIVNLGDKLNPRHIYTHPAQGSSFTQNVVLSGNIAFVTSSFGGFLEMLDVQYPYAPKSLARFSLRSFNGGLGLDLVNHSLYVSDGSDGFKIINLRKLSLIGRAEHTQRKEEVFPVMISAMDVEGYPSLNYGFTIRVNERPVSDNVFPMQSIAPGEEFTLPIEVNELIKAQDHTVLNYAIASTDNRPVPTWLTLTQHLEPAGEYPRKTSATSSDNHLGVYGNGAFVSYADYGTLLLDLKDFSTPQSVGRLTNSTCGLAMADNRAFTQSNGNLLTINFNYYTVNPISFYQNPSCELDYSADTLFATDAKYLYFLNVSDPYRVELIHRMTAPNSAMAVSDKTLFLANQTGLTIWDIANLSQPKLLSTRPGNLIPGDMLVSGGILYMGDKNHLQILNVSVPSHPQLLSTYDVGKISGIAISGKKLFLATGDKGLQGLNIQNLLNPKPIFSYTKATHVNDVAVHSPGVLLIVDEVQGFQILNLTTQWTLQAKPQMDEVGNYYLALTATNSFGSLASIPFTLRVEGGPRTVPNAIPDPFIAQIGLPFFYSLAAAFTDPNYDPLTYEVIRAHNKSLGLDWLQFNNLSGSLSGTPNQLDEDKIIDLQVIASDPLGHQTSAYLNISAKASPNVNALVTSSDYSATWALRYAGIALALLITAYAYHNRVRVWNAIQHRRNKNHRKEDSLEIGKSFECSLATPRDDIGSITVLVPSANNQLGFFKRRPVLSKCFQWFSSDFVPLPTLDTRPYWMHYDAASNSLCSKGIVPLDVFYSKFQVIVKDKKGYLTEEFVLNIYSLSSDIELEPEDKRFAQPQTDIELVPLKKEESPDADGSKTEIKIKQLTSTYPDRFLPSRRSSTSQNPGFEKASLVREVSC